MTREIERGGPCWLLKLRSWMGTQRGQIIGVLPWLVRWTHRAGTIDFCPALAVLVSPVLNIIFLTFSLYYCLSPGKLGRQACWVTCLGFCEWQTQRYTKITHDSPTVLFSVAQGMFWLTTERLSRSTLQLKEGVCTLVLCSLETVMSCDSDKIPEGGTSTFVLPSLWTDEREAVRIHNKNFWNPKLKEFRCKGFLTDLDGEMLRVAITSLVIWKLSSSSIRKIFVLKLFYVPLLGCGEAEWGCGVAKLLAHRVAVQNLRVRLPPGTLPLVQPGKQRCRFFPAKQQEIPAKQQACQPVTKDEYCRKKMNKKSAGKGTKT